MWFLFSFQSKNTYGFWSVIIFMLLAQLHEELLIVPAPSNECERNLVR